MSSYVRPLCIFLSLAPWRARHPSGSAHRIFFWKMPDRFRGGCLPVCFRIAAQLLLLLDIPSGGYISVKRILWSIKKFALQWAPGLCRSYVLARVCAAVRHPRSLHDSFAPHLLELFPLGRKTSRSHMSRYGRSVPEIRKRRKVL